MSRGDVVGIAYLAIAAGTLAWDILLAPKGSPRLFWVVSGLCLVAMALYWHRYLVAVVAIAFTLISIGWDLAGRHGWQGWRSK